MLTSIQTRFPSTGQPSRFRQGMTYLGLAALLAMSAVTAQTAFAANAFGDTSGIDNSGTFKSEMAACKSGKTAETQKICMTEARNAEAARRAGKLVVGGDYAANALKRCDVFKDNIDRDACRARLTDPTKIDGSVAGGGILREAEITVPADSSMPMMQKPMPMMQESMPMMQEPKK